LVTDLEAAVADPHVASAEVPSKLSVMRLSIHDLVQHLEAAQSATAAAISTADSYGLQVLDVGQEVKVSNAKLACCQKGAATLATQAQHALTQSQAALETARAELADRLAAVHEKKETDEGTIRKNQLSGQIQQKLREAAAAESERGERSQGSRGR